MSPHPGPGESLILAIDVGSSSVKAGLVDGAGRLVGTGSAAQHTYEDATGRREHEPAETWRAIVRSIRRVVDGRASRVAAISVTGPRGTFAIVGPDGRPRSRFLTWQDRRAAARAAQLAASSGDGFRATTGVGLDPSTVLPKLVWLRENVPEVVNGDWRIVTPQSDALVRLGAANYVVDLTVAGHIGLLDVAALTWDAGLLQAFDVPVAALPRLVAPGEVVGHLGHQVARRLGLREGIPLVAAGSDGICSELGAGVTEPGQCYAYLGTASAIGGPLAEPVLPADPGLILMPGSAPDRWRILGLAMAGGSARDWFMRSQGIRDHGRVDRLIEGSPPGAGGVQFIPTLAGAGAPVPDGRARAVFAGLSLASTRADLARAVHEGVALELRWMLDAIAESAPTPVELRLTGGGSRSDPWCAIVADVIGLPVVRVAEPNPGLVGAALYGLVALGRHRSVLTAARAVEVASREFPPRLRDRAVYDEAAETYRMLRRSLHDGGIDERLFRRTMSRDSGPATTG
jgi:sugar (pentulose or hexulose) kinase